MIATETIVPNRKLKIKFSTKRIEVDSGPKCEFEQQVSHIDESRCCKSNEKSSLPDSNKRGPAESTEGQTEKRQKIDRKGSLQCATILKSLISHPYSWVFSKPVDPVALNIPDYFTIISRPMDLGTIKSKLEKNIYSGAEEFAADVRLTFSNAMTYNPPGNDVHLMAKELRKVFDRKWKDLDKKWKCEDEHGKSVTGTIKETVRRSLNGTHPRHKDTLPKKSQVSEHKGIHKISSLAARDARVVVPKLSQIPFKLIEKDLHKGSKGNHDGEQPPGSVKACSSLRLVTRKCSICGDITCHCVIPSNSTQVSSDVSSDGCEGREDLSARGADALRQDCSTKCTSPTGKKSDPDSDGAVSSLDSEHVCSSSELVTPATDASSVEVWSTPVFPAQLSPKKALRAAMLKSRFADTILKAQQKTLLEHGDKGDPLKMQLEKERLERIQREERARIEAQIKTAEAAARMRAEEELRQRREKEREAARAAIEKMKRTVEIEHNMEIIKELESLSGCTLSYKAVGGRNGYKVAMETLDKPLIENPLERLGLFIKDEYTADEDEEVLNGGWEEGEIF
ncbi:transcription factor GTE12 isoform X1 [Abrus precatorius]|uniref:Transcription factor GTE12 isoform X1 n=1 Tax=Abrus precatorius TaxID=3816 RepID=A0A8B8JHD9_ABRPR|nr:transcription factor GTE12 isoform X1 [Abrus precatorius]